MITRVVARKHLFPAAPTKGGSNSDNWEVLFKSICKDYTDNDNMNKTTRYVYEKYMIKIIKTESKIQDEYVYLLAGGTLTTNTVQIKNVL